MVVLVEVVLVKVVLVEVVFVEVVLVVVVIAMVVVVVVVGVVEGHIVVFQDSQSGTRLNPVSIPFVYLAAFSS